MAFLILLILSIIESLVILLRDMNYYLCVLQKIVNNLGIFFNLFVQRVWPLLTPPIRIYSLPTLRLLICCCSVAQLCPIFYDQMDCSTPGFPVLRYLPEFAQTPVHWVNDTIQPSHPLSSPSPPALNLSQHQGLSQWVSSSPQVAKVLEFQLQHLSMNTRDWSPLGWPGWISLQAKGLSRIFSKPQFKSTNS